MFNFLNNIFNEGDTTMARTKLSKTEKVRNLFTKAETFLGKL